MYAVHSEYIRTCIHAQNAARFNSRLLPRLCPPSVVNYSAVNILITVQQIQLTRTRSHNLLLLLLILKRNEKKKK